MGDSVNWRMKHYETHTICSFALIDCIALFHCSKQQRSNTIILISFKKKVTNTYHKTLSHCSMWEKLMYSHCWFYNSKLIPDENSIKCNRKYLFHEDCFTHNLKLSEVETMC